MDGNFTFAPGFELGKNGKAGREITLPHFSEFQSPARVRGRRREEDSKRGDRIARKLTSPLARFVPKG